MRIIKKKIKQIKNNNIYRVSYIYIYIDSFDFIVGRA